MCVCVCVCVCVCLCLREREREREIQNTRMDKPQRLIRISKYILRINWFLKWLTILTRLQFHNKKPKSFQFWCFAVMWLKISFFYDMMLPQWVMGSRVFEKTQLSTLKLKYPTLYRTVGVRMPTARATCFRRIECSNQNQSRIGSQEVKYWLELIPCYLGRRSIDSGTVLTWKYRCNFCAHDIGTPRFLTFVKQTVTIK